MAIGRIDFERSRLNPRRPREQNQETKHRMYVVSIKLLRCVFGHFEDLNLRSCVPQGPVNMRRKNKVKMQ